MVAGDFIQPQLGSDSQHCVDDGIDCGARRANGRCVAVDQNRKHDLGSTVGCGVAQQGSRVQQHPSILNEQGAVATAGPKHRVSPSKSKKETFPRERLHCACRASPQRGYRLAFDIQVGGYMLVSSVAMRMR